MAENESPATRVRGENKAFREQLPTLIPALEGRWVVFREGRVISDHATGAEAYASAVAQFGQRGGFLVAEVREIKPTPLTAGALFIGAP